jgi:hypothetical protein
MSIPTYGLNDADGASQNPEQYGIIHVLTTPNQHTRLPARYPRHLRYAHNAQYMAETRHFLTSEHEIHSPVIGGRCNLRGCVITDE